MENNITRGFRIDSFYKAGLIENWGRGTIGVIEECENAGLPKPEFEYEWESINETFSKTTQKSTKEKIVELLLIDGKQTRENLATELGVSTETHKKTSCKSKVRGDYSS